jgi:hypothetical protein
VVISLYASPVAAILQRSNNQENGNSSSSER